MLAAAIFGLVALLTASALPGPARSAALAQSSDNSSDETEVAAGAWSQTFDGKPASPQPWNPADWDVQVHSRDRETWKQLQPMAAHHGGACSAPPDTHVISSYADAVYQCNDHVMTSIYAEGYGVIYLTPNQMVDFSSGAAVVHFDMSTFRSSSRDWVDLWLSPFEDQMALPWRDSNPDLTGPPRRAIHVEMGLSNGKTNFSAAIYNNFQQFGLDNAWWTGYEDVLTPSAVRRDTFELRISRTSLKFGMPTYNIWWVDQHFNDIGWDKAVLQLGHHSYNPAKDCPSGSTCGPDTWHWDNVSISTPKPFTILKADQPYLDGTTQKFVTFAQPAPAGSFLRFAGIGDEIDVSFDGGHNYYKANIQAAVSTPDEHFRGFWTPIPAGTTRIDFKGKGWWGGDWMARGISVWSQTVGAPVAQPPAPPATATPVAIAPTPTSTTPAPVAGCTPRPKVAVQTQPAGTDHLQVTVQVARPSNMPSNQLRNVQFLRSTNASVSVQGQTIPASGGTVTTPAGSTSLGFMVSRQPPGSQTAVTVPFVVTDDCGGWNTFVGGGGTAF
jgi:hypothetical protein